MAQPQKVRVSVVDRPLSRPKADVNLSAYALLFSEIVSYSQSRVGSVQDLQARLAAMGARVGVRVLELASVRERSWRRETKLLSMLIYVKGPTWKALFGKEADKLERSNADECQYYLIEREPLVNRFISVPKDKGSLNCAAFAGGIVEGILSSAGFACKVSVTWQQENTYYVIQFDEAVIARDKMMEAR